MLGHVITSEDSFFRQRLLKRYARHEVFLLSVFYRLLRSRLIRSRVASEMLYRVLAYPMARWGIAGTPLSPRELEPFLAGGSRTAVGPCRCRLAHSGCGHRLETDIVLRTGFGAWTEVFPEDFREITAGEALRIAKECHEEGMAQISYAHLDVRGRGSFFVLCNCCTDGCLPLLARKHYGSDRYPFHRGKERTYVETSACQACGTCVEMCPFEARSRGPDRRARVGVCYGCGLCVSHCAAGAARYV
jgi:ferredoxin